MSWSELNTAPLWVNSTPDAASAAIRNGLGKRAVDPKTDRRPVVEQHHQRLSQLGRFQPQAPQAADQDIGQGRQVQPHLVGPQRLGAHPIGKQAELLLDPILHVATAQ